MLFILTRNRQMWIKSKPNDRQVMQFKVYLSRDVSYVCDQVQQI